MMAMLPASALAVDPDEVLEDAALETRARDISRELRCITCQSQSIDDSDAPLAKELRVIVRERLVAGDSDEEVIAFMTDRYGDYVRLKPALRSDTAILWFAPIIAMAAAMGAAFFYFRQIQKKSNSEDLKPEEPYTDKQYTEDMGTDIPNTDKENDKRSVGG